MGRMRHAQRYLRAYDDQLRTEAETPSALRVTRLGPLRLATFLGGRGFVTYRDLAGAGAEQATEWVGLALDHFRTDPQIIQVEWKTRGHDRAPGLDAALLAAGFVAQETESIMIGEARLLDVDVPLPAGVLLRVVTDEDDVRAMSAMADRAFGDPVSEQMADALLHRLSLDDGMQLWVAQVGGQTVGGQMVGGQMVGAGRLEPVPDSDFAGIWGGSVLSDWRGRGIYRALTAARARAAVELGRTLIHSDSTEFSRPILERSGLIRVSTTTPYVWRR